MKIKSNVILKSLLLTLGLSLLLINITACQANERISENSEVKEVTVVIESTDYKSYGILYGHEEKNRLHKMNLVFDKEQQKNITDIEIDDIIKISYTETINENPIKIKVIDFEKSSK